MGVERPPLPAPTEPSTLSSIDNEPADDATNLSRRTDKTSYSIPEDGTPVTVPTARREHKKHPSQTSLLIEYFEAGKAEGKVHSRPSVRVRVTPSHRKKSDHVQITQTNRGARKPSYTRRIELGKQDEAPASDESNVSSRPPVEVEVLNGSDLSGHYMPVTSDISSMPPDSMLDEPAIRSPRRRRSRSLERGKDTLKAPARTRSRSLSKERITQRVMEKLQKDDISKLKEARASRDDVGKRTKHELSALGTESSLSSNTHRKSDSHSVRSAVSGTSSINNPKLLATVEDAIKRLILPELNMLKEERRGDREQINRLAGGYDSQRSSRRVSKTSSAPNIHGPEVVLNRDADHPGKVLTESKSRRSSRSSHDDRRKHKDDRSARDAAIAGLAGAGLTAVALSHHNSRESHSDRRKRRNSRSRSSLDSEKHVPPMPVLQSELQSSDLTRDSILSAETEGRVSRASRSGTDTPVREVRRGSGQLISPSSSRTPVARNRSQGDISVQSDRRVEEQYERELSPVQSVASYRISPRASVSGPSISGKKSSLSIQSMESSPSTKLARTRKRPQGVNLEIDRESLPDERPADSPVSRDEMMTEQDVQGIGMNPEYVHTPVAVESAVASLHDPSTVSVRSSQSPRRAEQIEGHWGAIRDHAKTLSKPPSEPQLGATAFPQSDMPEIGYGVDDDVTTNPSIIQGPGDEYEWEDDVTQQQQQQQHQQQQQQHQQQQHQQEQQRRQSMEEMVDEDEVNFEASPQWKDEGYMSAAQPAVTPDLTLHGRRASGGHSPATPDFSQHVRHASGNSHGMASPLYDAATGTGIDRIQSKDVVALMDHLTVRDAQRNARDTEILVTLVRSAAEMRNSFEEMKQFIRTQDAMLMQTTDKRVDVAEQRLLGGPRPQPTSPRIARSSTEDVDDVSRKKNVFRRALKGLGMKGESDIKKIEQMLMQLLTEVEDLKNVQHLQLQANRSNSLASYENLRASGDPGYEPEGCAGTSSPNQSSNPSSRRVQDVLEHQPHRISTVEEEGDEEEPPGMTTPTQEVRRSPETTPKRKHKSNSSSLFGFSKNLSRWSKTTASTNPERTPRNSGDKRIYSDASRSGSQINLADYDMQTDDRLLRSPSPLIPEEPQLDDPKYQAHRNSLNLQHPQPRPGPTHRHQSHLEVAGADLRAASVARLRPMGLESVAGTAPERRSFSRAGFACDQGEARRRAADAAADGSRPAAANVLEPERVWQSRRVDAAGAHPGGALQPGDGPPCMPSYRSARRV